MLGTLLFVFIGAIVGGIVAKKLRQPMILGYIASGVFVGTVFPRFVDQTLVHTISEIGVTLLLFTLGVEFSFHRLKTIMRIVSWAAIVQILVCFTLFFAVSLLFFPLLPSLFLAAAAALSSTAVVVRILGEKGELDTIPGEILTGWLVIQDLSVIPMMILMPAIVLAYRSGSATIVSTAGLLGVEIVKASLVLGLIIFFGKIGFPWLLSRIAKFGNREIFLLTIVGLVLGTASACLLVGLSPALGAFIAGLLVAETAQNHAVFSEIRPLRDIFAIVFFVSLGMALPLSLLIPILLTVVWMTLGIILIKMIVVYFLTRFLGYHRKTAFLVGLGLTQVSEFGCIIAAVGLSSGAISQTEYTLIIALVFATILVSAPLFARGQELYYKLRHLLGKIWPQLIKNKIEQELFREELPIEDHVVICGYGRVGKYIGRALAMAGIPFIVIDYNHTTVHTLREKGIRTVYGDPSDIEVLDYAQVDKARVVIIAIPDRHTQEMVVANALTLSKTVRIICRTHHEEDQARLKAMGVHMIVQPEFEASLAIVTKILAQFGIQEDEITGKISRLKIEHGLG